MLGQLGAERGLDHPPRELGEQATRPGDLLRVEALQRVLELIPRQQAGEPVDRVLAVPRRIAGHYLDGAGLRCLRVRGHGGSFPGRARARIADSPLRGSSSNRARQHEPLGQTQTSHTPSDRTGPGMPAPTTLRITSSCSISRSSRCRSARSNGETSRALTRPARATTSPMRAAGP